MAHTPGPWVAHKGVSPSDDMRCGVVAVRGDVSYLLATIENGAPGDFCDTEYANAHLIAAAPDLLEAALNMRGLYDTPVERRRREGDPLYADAIEQLRAATLKAEGLQSHEGGDRG